MVVHVGRVVVYMPSKEDCIGSTCGAMSVRSVLMFSDDPASTYLLQAPVDQLFVLGLTTFWLGV
eukprot:scaffold309146_cov14-Tisochrysis_lutea.AAC.1